MTCNASSSPVEIRVPALNVSVHGLCGGCGWRPGCACCLTTKKRSNEASSAAGVPGGSAW